MKPSYVEQLTWLRGIAAFLVIVSHSIRASEIKYSPMDERSYFLPLGILDLGSFGVALFFTLSGCTLWISNGHTFTPAKIAGFYLKRILRIWPAYFVSLLTYMAFIELFKILYDGPYHPHLYGFFHDDYSLSDLIKYLTLSFNITGPKGLFTGAYWSLPVEFQYYILFPLLTFIAYRTKGVGTIAAGAVLYTLWIVHAVDFNRYEVLNLAYTFCAGITIGYLYTEKVIQWRFPVAIGLSLTAICFAISSFIYNKGLLSITTEDIVFREWDWYGICAILSVFFLLFTNFERSTHPAIKFLSLYGKISYSIYLLHGLVIGTAILIVTNFGIFGDSPKLFFIFTFTLTLSFVIAFFSYKYVELPGIKLGKKIHAFFSERRQRLTEVV